MNNLCTDPYHIDDSGEAEKLDVDQTDEITAVVETGSFSLYTVEFTYNKLVYVMQGGATVALSEIMDKVGLSGEVTAVETSNADLLSASDESGSWMVTAHQAFSTEAWMKVTISGIVYEITVTDDQAGAVQVTTWADLQAALNAGGDVVLAQDLTPEEEDEALSIPAGVTVGLDLNNHSLTNRTENGGAVTAIGGSNGAGIGGGRASNAGSITIYGGTVTATGKDDAAGIGGGDSDNSSTGNAGNIRIFGGTVTATSSGKGAAIGGSDYGTTKVTITGGKVRATSDSGVGIGGGGKLESDTSTVTLGYTDASKDGISITASSFSGSVKLEERFFNSKGHYDAGSVSSQNVSKLAGNALRAWDGEVRTWADLQSVIKGAKNGSTIKLTQSYTALSTDSALSIPNSRALTIDLNGFTLDRGLRDGAKENGYVIVVSSTGGLTLRDSQGGGAITGGYNRGDAGGILNKGALTIENAAITGNKATGSGAGIHNTGTLTINGGSITKNASENWHGGGIYNAGTLKLKGGSITGNSAKNGQGGGILQNGKMNVSGAPVVNDNSAKTGNNIFLRLSHATIEVTGELTEGANLHVNLEDDGYGTITTGYAKYNKAHPNMVFHSDERQYPDIVQLNGEAHLTIAAAGVPYISCSWKDGKLVKEEKTTDTTWISWTYGNEIPGGKYVLNSYEPTWKVEDRIYLQDDTSILLCDGKTLDVEGLYIPAGKTLTIYGQSGGTGIGSGVYGKASTITISGGEVVAKVHANADSNAVGMGSRSNKGTSTMTFSYTDETGDDISITAPSYGGRVVLRNNFVVADMSAAFGPATYTNTAAMEGKALIKYATLPVEYRDLANAPHTENCYPIVTTIHSWNDGWYALTKSMSIKAIPHDTAAHQAADFPPVI